MTAQDRELFDEKFGGLTTLMNAQFINVNETLKGINDHLAKLNGKVYEHEKVISQNIPHAINHCVQTAQITELRDNMVTTRGVRKAVLTGFGAASAIAGVFWITFQLIKYFTT